LSYFDFHSVGKPLAAGALVSGNFTNSRFSIHYDYQSLGPGQGGAEDKMDKPAPYRNIEHQMDIHIWGAAGQPCLGE
jgi:hypothetical protein